MVPVSEIETVDVSVLTHSTTFHFSHNLDQPHTPELTYSLCFWFFVPEVYVATVSRTPSWPNIIIFLTSPYVANFHFLCLFANQAIESVSARILDSALAQRTGNRYSTIRTSTSMAPTTLHAFRTTLLASHRLTFSHTKVRLKFSWYITKGTLNLGSCKKGRPLIRESP